jgi:signal transduction histidine kinase
MRVRVAEIVAAWTERVHHELPDAHRLTFEQLRDDVPEILRMLADALEHCSEGSARDLVERLPNHGKTRFNQGYDESELLIEFRLLRQAVIEQVAVDMPRPLTTQEHLAIDAGIDAAMHQSMMAFADYQRAEIRAANETEARFLAYLSHDLRNNLAAVAMALRNMHQRLASSAEFAADATALETLDEGIELTVSGMERLLHAEYLRSGKIEPRHEPVQLRSLVAVVVGQLANQAAGKGVVLANEVTPDVIVESDRALLYVIIHNLAHNAVKYSAAGTVRVYAERRGGAPDNPRWVLSVSDEGPGIADEHLTAIFEHFARGETFGQAGVGLGLAIAARAAHLLGADLSVRSEIGVGSVFSLVF